jgi:hypothetical protein
MRSSSLDRRLLALLLLNTRAHVEDGMLTDPESWKLTPLHHKGASAMTRPFTLFLLLFFECIMSSVCSS